MNRVYELKAENDHTAFLDECHALNITVLAGFPLQLPPAASPCGLPPMDNGGVQMPNGVVSGAAALIDARVQWAARPAGAAPAGVVARAPAWHRGRALAGLPAGAARRSGASAAPAPPA